MDNWFIDGGLKCLRDNWWIISDNWHPIWVPTKSLTAEVPPTHCWVIGGRKKEIAIDCYRPTSPGSSRISKKESVWSTTIYIYVICMCISMYIYICVCSSVFICDLLMYCFIWPCHRFQAPPPGCWRLGRRPHRHRPARSAGHIPRLEPCFGETDTPSRLWYDIYIMYILYYIYIIIYIYILYYIYIYTTYIYICTPYYIYINIYTYSLVCSV